MRRCIEHEHTHLAHAALVFFVASGLLGSTQVASMAQTITSCSEELQIPRYGPSGEVGTKLGPFIVTIIPDQTGHPGSISIEGASRDVTLLVKSWLSGSTFALKCAGKELVLQLSFII